jgi:hypothetical protein
VRQQERQDRRLNQELRDDGVKDLGDERFSQLLR